ncbi:hypothetical protein [Streptomyces albogriseolus]|uniref:hypothetical protein n=1 Tax=Streptomyces albogriseolus TaxID=1887 RepID=UPI0034601DC0
MAAISVGSVEVDVVPNTRGFRARMQDGLVPAANQVGDEISRIIGRHITRGVADAVRQGVQNGARTAQPAAVRGGQQTGSAYARSLKASVQAALRDLPEIRLDADSTPAQREIATIRAQLQTLADAEVGVDIDAGEANARIAQLQARLQRLAASDADVDVRMDVTAASAQLAAFQAAVNRLDGQTAHVNVDTRSAAANMSLLTSAALTLGPAILPVLPVIAAGLGAIAAAGAAASVGVGAVALVAVPAFKQIGSVLQAQKAAQDAATNATMQGGQAAAQAASRANQLASAQAAVASAERNGARQIQRAHEQVAQARRNAAQTAAQAAVRAQQAARAVEDAEESLADAQRDARRAQEDLTAARRIAARELQDLNAQLAGAELDQRQAVLDLQDAERELRAVRAQGSKAQAGDLERAQLNYDRAKQNLKDQTTETSRLKQETAAANKAGVEGSDTVRTAQERLADAQEQVADRARAVKDAQAEQARTAAENAQRIADAQRQVADAQRGVSEAQVQAAEQAAAAQRQLAQAQQAGTGSVDQAAIAQAKYRAELAKLSPAARQTMTAYLGLRDAFGAWSRSLQPAVMPIFTRALNGMKRALPGLTPFVLEASSAIQGLMDRASQELKTPFWRRFRDDLEKSVKPAIEGLGVSFGNVFKGMAGIIGGFLPHMDSISARMQNVTKRFADWGAGLRDSPEFRDFLSYSSEMAPRLGGALKEVATAALRIAQGMSPISRIVLGVVEKVAQGIGWLAEKAPWLVTTIYGAAAAFGAWRIALLLWSGAMWLAGKAYKAFDLIMKMSTFGLIVLAVIAVVAVIILLWKKCDWFRNAIKGVWAAIKSAALAVKNWFAGPFANFFTKTIPAVFRSVLDWVKRNWPWILGALTGPIGLAVVWIIKNWDKIKDGLFKGWDWIKQHVLFPIRDFFTVTIPGWGTTLREKMVGAFKSAADGIKTAWDRIRAIAKKPVEYVVNTVYNQGIRRVWGYVSKAFGGDPLPEFTGFAKGGVLPGYTPGRDVHKFVSPTGGGLELSGGEAIMRPEFTRAVGSGFVHSMNAIAKSRGAQGIKAALAPVFGGDPDVPTDRSLRYSTGGVVQRFADGGIFGWIKSKAAAAAGVGSDVWNGVKSAASWLGDTLEASARAGAKNIIDPLLKKFPGMDTGFGRLIRRIPTKVLDSLFGYSKEADKRGAGGVGGPKVARALRWAKAQAGKPYLWGGVGPRGYDCSGFMGAIENVIRGRDPYSRRWATGAFSGRTAPPGWVKNGNSAFRVGITNAGVGHTAGTLGRVNVESRGGDGVVVGSRARGYKSPLFTDWYGFMPGTYDSGGMLQPGLNLAYNGTGRPEPVLTGRQWDTLAAAGRQQQPVIVELHAKEGALGDFIDVRVRQHDQALVQVLNAG